MNAVDAVWSDVQAIRARVPLVHNITNYVAMNSTANALLALGASPVMAHAEDEVDEMVAIADALVINIGTLSQPWIAAMRKALRAAVARGIPTVLDPVGAGATRLRTETARRMLEETPPTVLRGNGSEILALCGGDGGARGVDSRHGSEAAVEAARRLSERHGCVVCVSGETDYVVQGGQTRRVLNGHVLMTRVTGLGCTASALTGAFCTVNPDPLAATAHAMGVLGVAGELAEAESAGPGSLQVHLLDSLYRLACHDLVSRLRLDDAR